MSFCIRFMLLQPLRLASRVTSPYTGAAFCAILLECNSQWVLPTKPHIEDPNKFFSTIANGVWHRSADWITQTTLEESPEPNAWRLAEKGVYYNPHRISDEKINGSLLELVNRFAKKMPVEVIESKGYMISTFENGDGYVMHFLASDYDTDIDHALDEMRFHRSRVNYVNKVTPVNVSDKLILKTQMLPEVFLPFGEEKASVSCENGICEITLPKDTSYLIVKLK